MNRSSGEEADLALKNDPASSTTAFTHMYIVLFYFIKWKIKLSLYLNVPGSFFKDKICKLTVCLLSAGFFILFYFYSFFSLNGR